MAIDTNNSKEEISNQQQLAKFCPLIKTKCRNDCACFNKAWTTETKHMVEANCMSPLIDGYISVEGDILNNY